MSKPASVVAPGIKARAAEAKLALNRLSDLLAATSDTDSADATLDTIATDLATAQSAVDTLITDAAAL